MSYKNPDSDNESGFFNSNLQCYFLISRLSNSDISSALKLKST